MKVNPQQLLDDGFIILRQVIPPDQLDALRTSFEILVDRQKAIWRRERKPDDPPGGTWETSAQPRVFFNEVVDEKTADAVDFCLGENTLGVSRQLTRSSDAAVTLMALMCSPPARPWPRELASRCGSHCPSALERYAEGYVGERTRLCSMEHSAVR